MSGGHETGRPTRSTPPPLTARTGWGSASSKNGLQLVSACTRGSGGDQQGAERNKRASTRRSASADRAPTYGDSAQGGAHSWRLDSTVVHSVPPDPLREASFHSGRT